jgi:hypothetical protein
MEFADVEIRIFDTPVTVVEVSADVESSLILASGCPRLIRRKGVQ